VLFDGAEGPVIDGYRRIDNVTEEALARFRAAYGRSITKDDVFFYVYGLLHSPDYRAQFAADLKKMLPRISLVANAVAFIDAGRALTELHVGVPVRKALPARRTARPTRRRARGRERRGIPAVPGGEDALRQAHGRAEAGRAAR
jgi:predicted helicase